MLTASPSVPQPGIAPVRKLRVAVAGCGVVGGELLRMIEHQRDTLAAGRGVQITIARVLVRDPARERRTTIAPGILTTDVEDFLGTPADVVVEAIGGIDPAVRIVRRSLARGVHVVTANKSLVAAHGSELAALALGSRAAFRFDAAVGGGVPILRLLTDALGDGIPGRIRGILNGTSNFVLTRLDDGAALSEALGDARRLGFAEADATRDLDGRDAADKLAILAWAAFGIRPEQVIVRRRSLLPDPARLVRLARAAGGLVRQVGECELGNAGETLFASVEPTVVRQGSALGRTCNEANHIEVDNGWNSPLSAGGPGAGGRPTATAVLSDLLGPFASSFPRATRIRPAADTRPFGWLIGTSSRENVLLAGAGSAGITVVRSGTSGTDAWVRTAPCAWGALHSLLAGLDQPVVARDGLVDSASQARISWA